MTKYKHKHEYSFIKIRTHILLKQKHLDLIFVNSEWWLNAPWEKIMYIDYVDLCIDQKEEN